MKPISETLTGGDRDGRAPPEMIGKSHNLLASGEFAGALDLEEGAFAPDATAVAAQVAALGDDAVAGDEEIEAVGGVGAGDGADGRGGADTSGNLLVAGGAAKGNENQLAPYAFLKFGAAKLEGDGKFAEGAVEVVV